MTWQLFTLISVVSLSVSVILQRILLHKDKSDPFAYVIVFQAIVGVVLMTFALSVGFTLPNIQAVIVPAIASVVLFGIGHIVYAKTLQRVEASAFSILFATQAIWTMGLGIVLLGESLSLLQIIGTLLIFISVSALARNFRAVFRDKGTLLGLLTGLLFGVAIYLWSYVGRNTDATSWAAISFFGTSLSALLLRPSAVRRIRPLLHGKVLWRLLALGVTYGLGSLTMLYAYKYGEFSVVSPLRQASIILTVLLALVLLPRERNAIRKKLIAAALCTVGVVLIII